jgi:hypothetical protein
MSTDERDLIENPANALIIYILQCTGNECWNRIKPIWVLLSGQDEKTAL